MATSLAPELAHSSKLGHGTLGSEHCPVENHCVLREQTSALDHTQQVLGAPLAGHLPKRISGFPQKLHYFCSTSHPSLANFTLLGATVQLKQ